jgi:uncharacterized protein YbaR (Trm112 family)
MKKSELKQLIKEVITQTSRKAGLKKHIEDYVKYHPNDDADGVVDGMEDEARAAGIDFRQLKIMAQTAINKFQTQDNGGLGLALFDQWLEDGAKDAPYSMKYVSDWLFNKGYTNAIPGQVWKAFVYAHDDYTENPEKYVIKENEDDHEMRQWQKGIQRYNQLHSQRYPCPTCKTPDALSAWQKKQGYQCDGCANSEEGVYEGKENGGWFKDGEPAYFQEFQHPNNANMNPCHLVIWRDKPKPNGANVPACKSPDWKNLEQEYADTAMSVYALTCPQCKKYLAVWNKTHPEHSIPPSSPTARQAYKQAYHRGEADENVLNESSISRNVNPTDKASGVVGYYQRILPCHSCGKPTNLIFKNDYNKECIACSKECANKDLD